MLSVPTIHIGGIPDKQAQMCLRLSVVLGHRWAVAVRDGDIPAEFPNLAALSSATEALIDEQEFVGGIVSPNEPDADGVIHHASGHGSVVYSCFPDGRAVVDFNDRTGRLAVVLSLGMGLTTMGWTNVGRAAPMQLLSDIFYQISSMLGEAPGWLPDDLHTGLAEKLRAFRREEAASLAASDAEWAAMRAAPCEIAVETRCVISRRTK